MNETTRNGLVAITVVLLFCLAVNGFINPTAPQATVTQENKTVDENVVNIVRDDNIFTPVPAPVRQQAEIMFSDIVPLFAVSGSLTDSEIKDGLVIYNASIYRAREKENITEASLLAYIPQKKDRVAIGNGFFDQVIYLGNDGKVHSATNVTVREGVQAPPCYKLMLEDKSSKAASDKLYFYLFGDKGRTAIGITRTKLSPPVSGSGGVASSLYDSSSEVGGSNTGGSNTGGSNTGESNTGDNNSPGDSGGGEGPVGDELAA